MIQVVTTRISIIYSRDSGFYDQKYRACEWSFCLNIFQMRQNASEERVQQVGTTKRTLFHVLFLQFKSDIGERRRLRTAPSNCQTSITPVFPNIGKRLEGNST